MSSSSPVRKMNYKYNIRFRSGLASFVPVFDPFDPVTILLSRFDFSNAFRDRITEACFGEQAIRSVCTFLVD